MSHAQLYEARGLLAETIGRAKAVVEFPNIFEKDDIVEIMKLVEADVEKALRLIQEHQS